MSNPYDATNCNSRGEPLGVLSLTDEEFTELVLLIDDEPVDEDLLRGIRRKLVAKRKRLRKRIETERINA